MVDLEGPLAALTDFLDRWNGLPLLAAAIVALVVFQAARPLVRSGIVRVVERRAADDELATVFERIAAEVQSR